MTIAAGAKLGAYEIVTLVEGGADGLLKCSEAEWGLGAIRCGEGSTNYYLRVSGPDRKFRPR